MYTSIKYTSVISDIELEQIIKLQKKNLPHNISTSEKEKEGFLTVKHDFEILKKMNTHQPHIIAKDGDSVIAYALCMHQKFKNDIEILKPMFSMIDKHIETETTYIVMGQICIDKTYRKQGVFNGLYQKMKTELKEKYDLLITEVATNNSRSLQAHLAIGFKTLKVYTFDQIEWHIIYWDWQ